MKYITSPFVITNILWCQLVRIFCFSVFLYHSEVNIFGFMSVGRTKKKTCGDITLGLRKLWQAFSLIFSHFIDQTIH